MLAACSSGLQEDLPELDTAGSTKTTESRISSDRDDAEEKVSGKVVLNSRDLELVYEGKGKQTVGLRFNNVEVPRGADIKRAYIKFKADETDREAIRVRVWAEDTNDAAKFSDSKRNLSKRSKTSASVRWQLDSWKKRGERGSKQRTPDLRNVVEEVTKRKGWDSGNSMVFLISDGSTYYRRVAESYRGDKKGAPVLHIEYRGGERTSPSKPKPAAPPSRMKGSRAAIILDTDIGVDVDDAGALAVLHALADRGEAKILATVSNTYDPYAAASIDVINTYYGRPNIPVGRNSDKRQLPKATPWWRKNDAHFARDLAEEFPHNIDLEKVPSAVSVYREALASQPDGSVTVVSVGFLSNLADLLASKSDKYSLLSGKALVKRKVKELVIMGGSYPGSDRDLYIKGSQTGNVPPSVAIRVLDGWPTLMTFAAGNVCGDIDTGQTLGHKTPRSNPVREAYRLFFGRTGVGRESWDPCAVLYAVRGLSGPDGKTTFALPYVDKHLEVNQNGVSKWVAPNNNRHRRLTRKVSGNVLQALVESLMVAPPKR